VVWNVGVRWVGGLTCGFAGVFGDVFVIIFYVVDGEGVMRKGKGKCALTPGGHHGAFGRTFVGWLRFACFRGEKE
jgi:hypothetical protein